ncbi:MAG: hypothetical protein GY847_06550 [Proteobacteria bacterium]|nr:hypothetical protein [Pseudomonadota bacterium]
MTDTVGLPACQIARLIRIGEVSVSDVTKQHISRIEEVNGRLNAVIWPLFEQALARAEEADHQLARNKDDELGLLFGVPMTIKDQFFVRGTPVTCGLAHRAERSYDKEGSLVTRLRAQGAIILGKTNVPQLLVSHECHHAKFGEGKNPWNDQRTPGGSSGGEGAIIAAGGSALGLGGDMGGSIRIPSHFCGICGLKPTGTRFPNDDSPLAEGIVGDLLGFEGFIVQPGPMARTVDDLKLVMDALLEKPLTMSEMAPPVQWSSGQLNGVEQLTIGFFEDDGFFSPSSSIRRVVREAAGALEAIGAEVVSFQVPEVVYAMNLYMSLLCADGGRWIKQSLNGEPPINDVRSIMQAGVLPKAFRKLLASIMGAFGQKHAQKMLASSGSCSAADYWKLTAERTLHRARFREALDKKNIDILICPPHGLPAPYLGSNANGVEPVAASYAAIFNLLDMPAGVVAAGTVRKGEESDRSESKDRVEKDAAEIEKGSVGMPVGVQVVGRHWREHQVLSVMKSLETHFRAQPDFPHMSKMPT